MKTKKKTKTKSITLYIALVLVVAAVGIAGALLLGGQNSKAGALAVPTETQTGGVASTETAASEGQGITINKADITEEAAFIPYKAGDTDMEVVAIRASDGTVRTALNTCQVCYDSGRGYYKQEGDVLVCQNCGNRFGVDQVEVVKGGCNPVPVFEDEKTESEESITISDDVLAGYKTLFSNWKK